MKKFLSLVLALVMTMSLVTVSAGATEYKDFTDKDEIQYAEAVTVLNKLGIITGYSEGDFRPEGELTRGAAAKILVSLLIGPDAAAALGNESSPYPDVPAGNNFAGVISYCKTAKIISGYGDGTFRPQGTLTGYAFAKMLLGALGYKSEYEGFTGAGWNMNVARLGGEAGLFDRISFNGNATVTREQACQLALNTLKATMVEYSGGMNITNGEQSVVVNPERDYKTSNQEFATHISNRKANTYAANNAGNDLYTVEFGEEHFVDLRMDYDRNQNDWFGRPSNEWSWKKVTIGTFPIEPDYVFDKQTSHLDATDAAKNRATGLGGLKLDDGAKNTDYTDFWLNGEKVELNGGSWGTNDFGFTGEAKVANISDLTDNGVTVEVYVSDQVANWITDVVVIKTQLMEVRRVGSDYVSLQAYDNGKPDNPKDNVVIEGFNQKAINEPVTNVQSEDDAYAVLSGLKAGDIVAVVPVTDDGVTYDVAEVYVPEQVKGSLTGAETYSTSTGKDKKTVAVTVGGTKYNVAQWSKDLVDIDSDAVKVTKKDVTLYLDKNGNAMLAKDVGSTEDFIIIGNFTQTMKDGRIVTIANGWDISGETLELNLGTSKTAGDGFEPGDLAYYTNSTTNHADWRLDREGGKNPWNGDKGGEQIVSEYAVGEVSTKTKDNNPYEIKSSNVEVRIDEWGDKFTAMDKDNAFVTTDKSVKFVYVNYNNDGEVDSVEVKTGVQNVKNGEITKKGSSNYGAQVAVKKDAVKAVVIKSESTDAMSSNLMYIRERSGGVEKDENGNMIYKYTVVMMKPGESVDDEVVIYSDDDVRQDTFVAYTAKENANYSNFYDLRDHSSMTNRTTATYEAQLARMDGTNNSLLYLGNYDKIKGDNKKALDGGTPQVKTNTSSGAINTNGGVQNVVRIRNAEIVDLRFYGKTIPTGEREIRSIDDLKWYFNDKDNAKRLLKDETTGFLGDGTGNETFEMQLVVNDNPSSDYFRDVALIIITDRFAANTGLNETTCKSTTPDEGGEPGDKSSEKDVTLKVANDTTNTPYKNGGTVNLLASVASAATTINLTVSEGAKITRIEPVGITTGYSANIATGEVSFTAGQLGKNDMLIVDVEAADKSTDQYVYLFKTYDPATWVNDFVINNYSLAAGYTSDATWETAKSNFTVTNGVLDDGGSVILNNGKPADIQAQIESVLAALGYTNLSYEGITGTTVMNWTADETTDTGKKIERNLSFDFSGCQVLVYKQNDTKAATKPDDGNIVAATYKIGNPGASSALYNTDNVLSVGDIDLDGKMTVVAAANANVAVKAGHTYVKEAYAQVNYGTVTPNSTGALFDVTYYADGEEVDDDAWVELGTKLTVEVTVKEANAPINLTQYTGGATKSPITVTFAGVTTGVTVTGTSATGAVASSDYAVTFKTTGQAVSTDKITFAHTVVDADMDAWKYDCPNITFGGSST